MINFATPTRRLFPYSPPSDIGHGGCVTRSGTCDRRSQCGEEVVDRDTVSDGEINHDRPHTVTFGVRERRHPVFQTNHRITRLKARRPKTQ